MNVNDYRAALHTTALAATSAGMPTDVLSVMNLTDALIERGVFVVLVQQDFSTHEGRVQAALASPEVIRQMKDGKKINAIKELRAITRCGLREAKYAVEDSRVSGFLPDDYYSWRTP